MNKPSSPAGPWQQSRQRRRPAEPAQSPSTSRDPDPAPKAEPTAAAATVTAADDAIQTVELGRSARLEVLRRTSVGLYLDGGPLGDLLLPRRYAPRHAEPGMLLDVFLYLDSDDRPIATTETPKAQLGDTATLRVVDVNRTGAFLDWGLSKDLLLPFSEQSGPLSPGRWVTVHIYRDRATGRLCGSTKLNHFLAETAEPGEFHPRQAVQLMIAGRSELGWKAVINGSHLGMLFESEVSQPLRAGERLPGWIRQIRADGRIDLRISLADDRARDDLGTQILQSLRANGGRSQLTDKSPPDAIHRQYQVSKAAYKKAIGALYRERLIVISAGQIELTAAGQDAAGA